LDWVEWLSRRTGRSKSALAVGAGRSENALTRLAERDGGLLDSLTIRLLCEFTGMPGPDRYLQPGAAGLVDEAAPFEAETADRASVEMVRTALADRPLAKAWQLRTRALESAGLLVGDIVIADSGATPIGGDTVCAQVHDMRTGKAEIIFRLFEPPYLITASNDPALRRPMLIDNERVVVVGPITESFRSRRR
jgi:hypothetical protein